MTSTGIDWQQFFWQALLYLPVLLGWSLAILFCLVRWRENPKGAAYLGVAILLQFSGLALRFAVPYLFSLYSDSGTSLYSYINPTYFFLAISFLTFLPSWLFISMAVFARPKHYDYGGGPMLDDDAVR